MLCLHALALLLILLGWLSFRRSTHLHLTSGLPAGRLIYADTAEAGWQPAPQPLFSAAYQLAGKPDYLVETAQGAIPVEVKSSPAPPVPYLGHLLQLAAYCLLVEETTGVAPPHGLLKYADALYEVDFTPELRQELLETMAGIRQDRLAETVHRSHDQAGKCLACGFFEVCEEALS